MALCGLLGARGDRIRAAARFSSTSMRTHPMMDRILGVFVVALLLALGTAPASAAITGSILPAASFPPEGDVLTHDPNNPATPDTIERTIHTTRLIVQTFQVPETFDLSNMYLLIARGVTGASARVRIFPVANTLAASIQTDFDAAVTNGFLLNQTFNMPTTDVLTARETMRLELTGADVITLAATTGTAGYGLMITSTNGDAAPGAFTWRGGDATGGGFYAGGRQYYDDLATGGNSRTNRDFAVALLGEPFILGDVDGDGIGGEFPDDFNPIRDNFQKLVSERTDGDIVRNGKVDFADFRQWKTAFIAGGGALDGIDVSFLAVPEPSAIALALLGLIGSRNLRRARTRRS
jgi:hypothetical protein